MPIIGNMLNIAKQISPKLPTAYQEVEYIYETGIGGQAGGVINTGIYLDTETAFEVGYYATGASGSSVFNWGILASDNQDQDSLQFQLQRNNQTVNMLITIARQYHGVTNALTAGNHVIIVDFQNMKWMADDRVEHSLHIGDFVKSNKTVLLLGGHAGNSFYNRPGASIRVHHWIVRKGGAKIQHLIACKRKSDNVPGMYDIVNNTFFTNAADGSLIAGANIN